MEFDFYIGDKTQYYWMNLTAASKCLRYGWHDPNQEKTYFDLSPLQTFFGGVGTYYKTSKTSIDSAVNDTVSPTGDADGFFSIDNSGQVANYGNRQFIFGWINQQKVYGWCFVGSFHQVAVGRREGSSSFTLKVLSP